jgi:cytochrome b561
MSDHHASRSTGGISPSTANHYTRTAIALHWIVAALILFQIGFGWYLTGIPRGVPARSVVVNLHKSIGLTVGLLVLLRLAWRATHRPPAFPATLHAWEARLALWVHRTLYGCMLVMPLSGYLASNFSKFGIRFFGLLVLAPWGVDSRPVYVVLNSIHVATSYVFVALITAHVLAALKHALLDRDSVLARMWPRRASGSGSPP